MVQKNNIIKICTELDSPTPRIANEIAKKHNIFNIPSIIPTAFGLTLERGKYWKPGSTITVRFLNGSKTTQGRIKMAMKEWENYANIKFRFMSTGKTNVRIGVQFNRDPGSWSYIGTDALTIPQDKPTMNFGWLYDDTEQDEYNRVVFHETGHLLGCVHEHENPTVNIPWDKPAVYAYYKRTNNWDAATVDNNIFTKYSVNQTQFTQFDNKSIMLYAIPEELTIGNYSVGFNTALSDMDKWYIGVIYPFDYQGIVPLELNKEYQGDIGQQGESDFYSFDITADNTPTTIETEGKLDTIISLIDATTQRVLDWNDDRDRNLRNSYLSKNLNKGKYYVRVRHYSASGTGTYKIVIRTGAQPILTAPQSQQQQQTIELKDDE